MKVIAIVAHTLDGFIARNSGQFIDWSSLEDKKLFSSETKKGGVVVMGLNTFNTFKKPLKDRLNIVLTPEPEKSESTPGVVEFKNATPKAIIKDLKKRKFKQVFIGGGSWTYTEFLKAKLLDELWVTIEPVIFGQGISNFNDVLYNTRAQLLKVKKINKNTVHLRYKIIYE